MEIKINLNNPNHNLWKCSIDKKGAVTFGSSLSDSPQGGGCASFPSAAIQNNASLYALYKFKIGDSFLAVILPPKSISSHFLVSPVDVRQVEAEIHFLSKDSKTVFLFKDPSQLPKLDQSICNLWKKHGRWMQGDQEVANPFLKNA